MDQLHQGLVSLGFTAYEAKAFVALVALGEGSVRDISQRSGVPRPRTYDVLEKLAGRGLIQVGEGDRLRYQALNLEDVADRLMGGLVTTAGQVLSGLRQAQDSSEEAPSQACFIQNHRGVDIKALEVLGPADGNITIHFLTNGPLFCYAPRIIAASSRTSCAVVVDNDAEDFRGLLGEARLLRPSNTVDPSCKAVLGSGTNLEAILRSSAGSLLIYKEEGKRQAISAGPETAIDRITRRYLAMLLEASEEV